jgi:DegV family protein with EDD domain
MCFPLQPNQFPGVFAEVYNQWPKRLNEIVVLVLSSKLSGTYQSAINAKSMVKKKSVRIEVIDSLNVAMSLGLLAIQAARLASSGARLDEVVESIKDNISLIRPLMYFDTLKYLAKGGRVGKAQGLVGSCYQLNRLVTLDEESIALVRVRSQKPHDYLYK